MPKKKPPEDEHPFADLFTALDEAEKRAKPKEKTKADNLLKLIIDTIEAGNDPVKVLHEHILKGAPDDTPAVLYLQFIVPTTLKTDRYLKRYNKLHGDTVGDYKFQFNEDGTLTLTVHWK